VDARVDGALKAAFPDLDFLRLLQLADSTLPIGSLAHSFGLETMVAREILDVRNLSDFLHGFLEETGAMEAVFCRAAFRLVASAGVFPREDWIRLNSRLSALKPARESREASTTLGENFLRCVVSLHRSAGLDEVLAPGRDRLRGAGIHHCTAFGLVAGVLGFEEDITALAFLHQQTAALVSACQRLLPLGQTAASRILWDLKPVIMDVASRSAAIGIDDLCCFTPLLDCGAMEHPALTTRLFVS